MKNGKKPTKQQKQSMSYVGLDYNNWLVVKSLNDELHIVHRDTGQLKVIPN